MKGRPLSGGKKKTKRPPTIAIITRGHHLRLQFWTSYNSWWAMVESNASIAKRMSVARCHISLILSGDKWKGSKLGYPEYR